MVDALMMPTNALLGVKMSFCDGEENQNVHADGTRRYRSCFENRPEFKDGFQSKKGRDKRYNLILSQDNVSKKYL